MGGEWDDPEKVLKEMKRIKAEAIGDPEKALAALHGGSGIRQLRLPPQDPMGGLGTIAFPPSPQTQRVSFDARKEALDSISAVMQQQLDASLAQQIMQEEEERVLVKRSTLDALEARVADLEARIWDE